MITPNQETPQLAKALGLTVPLYLKREDLHPYGSHKGRSIPYMIEQYAGAGTSKFAISSSGNAALAATLYIQEYNQKFTESPLSLSIFVGENINKEKLSRLRAVIGDHMVTITQTDKPKQTVHKLNKSGEAKALRQSNDPLALVGYQSLVEELSQISRIEAVFVPTSSGTTAQALADKFPVYVVQTTACHPIAEMFEAGPRTLAESSIADAIVDRVAIRKKELVPKLAGAYIATDREIDAAIKLVRETCGIEISPNASLSVAGLGKALEKGWQVAGKVVCLITGA
ncbi:MAG: PLP-dependent lyase/thiolase [Patescibacteria group bacterium]